MTQGGKIYRAAERRLLDAIRAGVVCDFADGAEITAAEMASWGPERTVRAALLRRLIIAIAEDAEKSELGVQLWGAAVDGILDLEGLKVMPLDLGHCRMATVKASRATFIGSTRFDGATFTHDAIFEKASFNTSIDFSGATFTGNARFADTTFTGEAKFDEASFTGAALFVGATFTAQAGFGRASFNDITNFIGATFTDVALFIFTLFNGDAWFDNQTFASSAAFTGSTFTGRASFTRAVFKDDADFTFATFTDRAVFANANFSSNALFGGAIADTFDLSDAQFHTRDPGPWTALRVVLTGAVFHTRARVVIAALKSDCRRLHPLEGVHLLGRAGAVDFEDTEFLRRSILEHSPWEPSPPERDHPGERPEGLAALTPIEQAQWTASEKVFELGVKLADDLWPQRAMSTRLVSLRRATASDLLLAGVGLEDCAFAGAHGLDKLRIDATCSFRRPPDRSWRAWHPFTERRLILEEARWRQTHTPGWPPVSIDTIGRSELDDPVPTALEIAGIYRDLRKGLEDAKDEPGAGDFYYGEMEMRRLAARGHQQEIDKGRVRGRQSSWTERRLLDAYWAVSGYGLRAWRALTALAVLLVVCAALFTLPAFAHLPDPPQQVASVNLATGAIHYAPTTQPSGKTGTTSAVPFGTSLRFTSESLTLIRTSGTPLLETTDAGTVLNIAVRLLTPFLLGLAVLAVRGRTKR